MRDFSKVAPSVWRSKKFRAIKSDDARLIYFYLLTCPHGNSAGCFDMLEGYACADMGMVSQRYQDGIADLCDVGLIVIDYLQLMTDSKAKSRFDEVSSVSRELKVLAKMIGCPVLALSQLNRGVESRPNKRPQMSDLRESGQIEQDADIISFIYRDDYYYEDSPNKNTAEIITAKFREGEVGTDILGTQLHFSRFVNFDPSSYVHDWEDKKPSGRARGGFDPQNN